MRLAPFVALAGILLLTGCAGPESVQAARQKVDLFHRQLDNGNYEAIWDGTAQDIRGKATKAQFIEMLEGVHAYYGKVRETTQVGWHAKIDESGSFAEVAMRTRFERDTGYENFIFRNLGNGQKLAGYHIDQDAPSSGDPE